MVLWFVVAAHVVILIANIASILVLPFVAPWYVAFPVETYLMGLMFTAAPCPLTKLEDNIRESLGMPRIKHFVGHYFVWPIKAKFRPRRRPQVIPAVE